MNKHPEELDKARQLSSQNIPLARAAAEIFEMAKAEADTLLDFVSLARTTISDCLDKRDENMAAVNASSLHAGESLTILNGLNYSEHNSDANTAKKQLAEGIRLLGRIGTGLGHVYTQLTQTYNDLDTHYRSIENDLAPNLQDAASILRNPGIKKLDYVPDVINSYTNRRDKEYDVLTEARSQFNGAKQTLIQATPEGAQDADLAADARPSPSAIAAALQETLTVLRPAADALQQIEAAIAQVRQLQEEAGRALMDWPTAPDSIKGRHMGLTEALSDLTSPVESNALHGTVEQLQATKDDFEGMQDTRAESDGLIAQARLLLGGTVQAVIRYMQRRGVGV
jgi:hypothetical protein